MIPPPTRFRHSRSRPSRATARGGAAATRLARRAAATRRATPRPSLGTRTPLERPCRDGAGVRRVVRVPGGRDPIHGGLPTARAVDEDEFFPVRNLIRLVSSHDRARVVSRHARRGAAAARVVARRSATPSPSPAPPCILPARGGEPGAVLRRGILHRRQRMRARDATAARRGRRREARDVARRGRVRRERGRVDRALERRRRGGRGGGRDGDGDGDGDGGRGARVVARRCTARRGCSTSATTSSRSRARRCTTASASATRRCRRRRRRRRRRRAKEEEEDDSRGAGTSS